jgi:hypothetical protein
MIRFVMRLPILAAAFWLAAPVAGQAAPQAPAPHPADLVHRAVSLIVTCGYGVQARQESKGVVKNTELTERERALQSRVSMLVLFRPGRFEYTGMWGERVNGVDVWTVTFAPAASGQPAVRPGEDERINRAMNNMTGFLQIDQATGGIVHVKAWLQSKMFFADVVTRFGVPSPVTVTILSATLTFDQRRAGKAWLPDHALLDLWAVASWWVLASPVHYMYPVSFTCAK